GYSDEDGTEAASYDGKLDEDEIRARVERVSSLVDEVTAERAAARRGEAIRVLVETVDGASVEGRADHQGPEVDGSTTMEVEGVHVGDLVAAVVVGSEGADLDARPIGAAR
ncbi:MAG: 30S ribosomal protein S12 methylthiotransferase RimO, partial [Nocardioidaceae bacterium]|nr:30S ribosomal protein S12 methylthiotransferase RimO [Nocardioidaceae bacterium]